MNRCAALTEQPYLFFWEEDHHTQLSPVFFRLASDMAIHQSAARIPASWPKRVPTQLEVAYNGLSHGMQSQTSSPDHQHHYPIPLPLFYDIRRARYQETAHADLP